MPAASCTLRSNHYDFTGEQLQRMAYNAKWSQRGCSNGHHTGTDRKSALRLALTHPPRPGILDLSNSQISSTSLCKKTGPSGGIIRKILYKVNAIYFHLITLPQPESVISSHIKSPWKVLDDNVNKITWLLAHSFILSAISPLNAINDSQAMMMVRTKINIWSSPNNDSYFWKKRNPYNWQLFGIKNF